MDDWAYDIVGEIERLPSEKELTFLFKDLPNRSNDDFFW